MGFKALRVTYCAGMDSHTADIAWARELAAGDKDALARYERELVPVIAAQLRRRGHDAEAIAELQQILRARLFVGDGTGPAIAAYEGRGTLKSWVLVSALREAVRMKQRGQREPATEHEALLALADRVVDDSDAPVKAAYREAFRAAFRDAIGLLAPRDRTLLRMHLLDGLTIDQIGALQGVHRATAARWVERARASVALAVRRAMMKQLGADPFDTDELLGWVQSRIELSLSVLATS